ncbi:heterokaryon incompatibility protein-domain-containing protein [Bombardia bombarda]|uniref:Heterokaryon incompatibility protein-domain-containing protein n=1 Tax=Bombardia bombarda TaxID=252184 RepID=A0AA40C1U2_9PEZI|nr:heterokaryon incompatibility protein-domain-containing protein [Bombardia bombarda]
MRLINVATLEVEEFQGTSIPKYAILSHTWGDGEASLQQWTRRLTRLRHHRKPGFVKINAACVQARRDGLPYLWADTVCIDKTSSAELSEAINSMYAWYANAKICYVYLSDVANRPADNTDTFDLVRQSRWFTRGWTLQELLAPTALIFYSKDWTLLGTKNALAVLISSVTGIPEICLHKRKRLDEYSIAQRMTWAANRITTREEDMAYCLLGIFGINMPLLYGEGINAFRRLQEEIIKVSDDHSIFAFKTDVSEGTLFAHHPSVFANGNGSRIHPNFALKITAPFSMTNAGLAMSTPLIRTLSPYWVLALLNCVEVDDLDNMRRSLVCLSLFGKDNRFMRARAPVSLISLKLDEPPVNTSDDIQDLTTRTETSYYISYFSRVYSVYGTEMDVAMNFGTHISPDSTESEQGFMLTFPRGMANYKLHAAFPANGLRENISFFIPSHFDFPRTDVVSPRGVIIFKDETADPPQHVAEDAIQLLEKADKKGFDETWTHYHQLQSAIVAARTRFKTLNGEPCKEAIMVEIVFDADQLLRERDIDDVRFMSRSSTGLSS